MTDPLVARRSLRLLLAVAACGVTLAWLAALLTPFELWGDPGGYNPLAALILTSMLHWVVGLPLAVACVAGVVEPWLWLAMVVAPVSHLVGSSIDAPGCWPFFLAPSVAVLVAGLVEVRYGRVFGFAR